MPNKILSVYALAILVGLCTGVLGSTFLLVINNGNQLLADAYVYTQAKGWPTGLISAFVSMGMVSLSWFLVKSFALEASGSGVQEIEGALLHERPIFWRRLLPVKFIGGALAMTAKLVVGREGPTIQMGGNLGEMIGELFNLSQHRRDSLIAAGAAAGLATAFNAPLAGILFVLEEMRSEFHFSFTNFSAVAFSCVTAVAILHLIVGAGPAIPMSVFALPSLRSLSLFFIFGIIVGLAGLLFNIVLIKSLHKVDKLSPRMKNIYVLAVGLVVGYLAYYHPEAVGSGDEIIEKSLTMDFPFSILSLLVLMRFITTMLCYSTGVPGGIFAPMLALGTLLGLATSHILQWLVVDISVHPGMFAVAGMGALFASVVRAPVTGIILVVEMTQNYSLILPLMVTCLTATTVVQLAGNPPIYTQLLRRTLKQKSG